MKLLSLKMWRRAMSLLAFLFGLTVLYLIYLAWSIVPGGTKPQTAGGLVAKDPRSVLAVIALAGELLAGLGLFGTRLAYFAYEKVTGLRHPKPVTKSLVLSFRRCPICNDNVPFGSLGRGFRGHLRSEHPDYWRSSMRWSVAMGAVFVGWLIGFFPLLVLVIVPASRTGEAAIMLYGFVGYFGIGFTVTILGAWSGRARRRRFREEWQEQHPLHERTYGNLKGIPAKLRVRTGVPVDVATLPLRLLHPVLLLLEPIVLLFARFSMRKVTLDKFEEGRLWFYDRFGTFTSFEIKNLLPEQSSAERIVLELKKGSLEIRAENSSDLETVRNVLSTAIIKTPA